MTVATVRHGERRGVIAWMFADWAGQPFHTLCVTFVFAPWFVEYGLGGGDAGQAAWGYMTALAGIAIAVLAPVLGAMADVSGPRKPWIAGLSLIHVAAVAALWFAVPDMEAPFVIFAAFAVALVTTELAFIFLNAMLPDLGPPERIGRISGGGWAMGYVGGLLSLVLVLGFMVADPESGLTQLGAEPILGLDPATGEGSRASGPVSAIWYAVFILPLFLLTPDAGRRAPGASAREGLAALGRTLRRLPSRPSLLRFLLSSMLYRDGLAALYAFAGIYAVGVLGVSIVQLGIFGILGAVTGTAGALVGGWLDDRLGPKPVVMFCVLSLATLSAGLLLMTERSVLGIPLEEGSMLPVTLFFALGAAIGAAGGALSAASRSLMVRQAGAAREMTRAFGLYGLAGKATAFVGFLLIGLVTDLTGSQRLGVTPVVALFLGGALLLVFVKPQGDSDRA